MVPPTDGPATVLPSPPTPERGDRRRSRREAVYRTEAPEVHVRSGGVRLTGHLLDASPFAVGVGVPVEVELAAGTRVDLQVRVTRDLAIDLLGCVASRSPGPAGTCRIGVTLATADEAGEALPFQCDPFFAPAATAPNPLAYQETVYFRLVGFGATELELVTSARNRLLLPGLPLQLELGLPEVREARFEVRVAHVESMSGDRLRVRARLTTPTPDVQEALGRFALQFVPGATLDRLRQAGLGVAGADDALALGYAIASDEVREVLALRLAATQHDGRLAGVSDPESLRDRYDAFARKLTARIHGQLVATARVVFPDGDPARSELENEVLPLPRWLWRAGFAEVGRVCTHPEYRGSDVLAAMLSHCGMIAHLAGVRYLVGTCVPELVPMYRRFGARVLSRRHPHALVPGRLLDVIVLDTTRMYSGRSSHPLLFGRFYLPLVRHWRERKALRFAAGDRLALAIGETLGPALRAGYDRLRRRRR